MTTLASTALTLVLGYVLVRAVMRRLAWEERRNPTPAMKRGEASRLWLLLLVPLAVGVVAVWTGHMDVARVCTATVLGAPWLFAGEKTWTKKASV